MHVHASDKELSEKGSAKFFVRSDGSTEMVERGRLKDREVLEIQKFIRNNYEEMYITWRSMSDKGYYENA